MRHVLLLMVVCPTKSVLLGFILNSHIYIKNINSQQQVLLSQLPFRTLDTTNPFQTMNCNTCIKLAVLQE